MAPPAKGLLDGLCLAALLPAMAYLSQSFGMTYDAPVQARYGELVLNYLQSGAQDLRALSFGNLYLYGGLFDTIGHILTEWWGEAQRWQVRHALNAGFGWLMIMATWCLGYRLGGRRTAWLALCLIILSPRIMGHTMNNPKDIPFAACYTAALFFLCGGGWRQLAAPYAHGHRWSDLIGFVCFTALALNIRVAGLMLLAFWTALLGLSTLHRSRGQKAWAIAQWVIVTMATVWLGTLVWPWAAADPLRNLVKALVAFGDFDWNGLVLFDGQMLPAKDLPWTYLPAWLLITTPLVVLVGGIFYFISIRQLQRSWVLLAVTAVPLLWAIASGATVYDGIRHFLFVIPGLTVLSALGIQRAWVRLRGHRRYQALLAVCLGLLCLGPLRFHLHHFPNQVVYFNPLVGGTAGAYGRFELDYHGNCFKQVADQAAQWARNHNQPLRISANFGHFAEHYAASTPWLEYAHSREAADLHIEILRHDPTTLQRMRQELTTTHYAVTVEEVPLCLGLQGHAPQPPKFAISSNHQERSPP